MSSKISLEKLIQGGAHFGHQVRRWNPKMEEYIYGSQKNVHLFDLTKTKICLEEALQVIKNVSKANEKILIVGTKKQIKDKIRDVANECGIYYVNERWLGGTLTNFEQIKRSTTKLDKMKAAMAGGEYEKYTKKEKLLLEREIQRLERYFSGIVGMEAIPSLLIIFDIRKEKGAVREANFREVETVAIVDSNCDPTLVNYPIPMNDDAKKALEYVLDLIKEAIMEGKASGPEGLRPGGGNKLKVTGDKKAEKKNTK